MHLKAISDEEPRLAPSLIACYNTSMKIKSVPPCNKLVPNTCGHVHAEGQDYNDMPSLCQRPADHPTKNQDGIGCFGCLYCKMEMLIAHQVIINQ